MYGLFAYKEITALRTKHVYRLEIYKKDFSGTAMELEEFNSSPFSITLEGEGDEVYRPVIKSSLSINIIDKDQFDYTQFFTSDAFGFRVFLLRNGVRLWSGYITPDSFGQDLQYRSTINLVARDNIGYLSEIDYDWFDYDFVSIEQLLTKAFDKIQAQFSLDNRVNIFSGNKPITDAYIQTVGLKDKTWFEVLEEVLSGCGLQLRYINDNYTLHDIANEVELGGNYTPTFIDRSQRVDFSPAWREEQLEQDYLKLDSFLNGIPADKDYNQSSKISTTVTGTNGSGSIPIYYYQLGSVWSSENLPNGLFVGNPSDYGETYNALLITSFNYDIDPRSYIYKRFNVLRTQESIQFDIAAWNTLFMPAPYRTKLQAAIYTYTSYYLNFRFNIFLYGASGVNYVYSKQGWITTITNFDDIDPHIILTGSESGKSVISNGEARWTTQQETLSITINGVPEDGRMIFAIYKWIASDAIDIAYPLDDVNPGYFARIDDIKAYYKTSNDTTGQESKITINESNNVKQSFDFKYGQIPDSSGGYLAFAGGLHDNDDYHTPLTDWYRSAFPGNKYNLLELVGRGLAHHGKKARKIMTGTILFDGQDFSKILVIDNEKYVINGGTYDVTKETLTGEFIEVEPYSTDDYVITGGAVSGGSSNISTGGNRDTLLWTDNAANTKRVNELGMATSDDLAGSNLLIDNPEWSEAKRISADMLDDKFYWDKSLDTTEDKSDKDSWIIRTKHSIVSDKGISAYGLGSTSGGSASGSLGELVNVGQWADEVPTADRVMVQLAGATHWSAKPLADLVGLDTAALAQYLTANSYLKASDISSYLTWANLSGKPTVYPTSWANIADKPTVYPTTWTSVTGRPTKLSQFTDDVVAGNYLPKPTWDAVFEVVTVDGTPALKVKYDILGLKGITAYAEGSLSGGFSGALVDLVDVAVTNLASGDILKYNGTHFVNVPVSSIAGASSWDQITGKPEYYPTRWADVSGAPTSLPASDVYPWAKAASKPTYTAAEVGALPLSGGKMITGDFQFKDGVAVRDYDSKNIIGLLNIAGDGVCVGVGNGIRKTRIVTPDDTPVYRNDSKGTYRIYDSGNFNPSSKLDKSVWDEAFEIKTVDGVRVISAKLDFLSVAGISAYATGPSSGGGGGGLDYDLLKQALTGAITPDGYPFTISASFLGAIGNTYLPLSGGTLTNTGNSAPLIITGSSLQACTKYMMNGSTVSGYFGVIAQGLNGAFMQYANGTISPSLIINNDAAPRFINTAGIQFILYHSGNFNPDSRFPYLGMGGINDNSNEIGAGYSGSSAGGNFNGPFIKFGQTSNYMTELYNRHDQDVFQIRRMVNGEWQAFVNLWHSGNFNPGNYLPLTGNKTITGSLTVANGFTSGIMKCQTGAYPQLQFEQTNTGVTSILFVHTNNALIYRPVDPGSDYTVYHSGNFNPGNYLLLSGGTMTGDITFGSNGRSLRGSDGGNIAGVLYDTPNARYVTAIGTGSRRLILVSPASIYRGAGGVAENYMIYDSGNSNLSSVDWSANNLNAAANLDVAGQAYVSGWLRSRGNVGWYSQDYGGGIHMTDSTWVRVYGSKGLMIDTGTSPISMGQLQITCSAEASIGFRSASNGNWCLGKGVKSIGSGFGLYNAVTNRAAFQIDSATDNASFVGSITAPTFVGNLSGSASSVNGYDINSFTGYYKYTIDASSLDQNTYYPVTMYLGVHHTVRISVLVALDSGTKPAWSSHASGYSVRFIEEVNGSGWGTSEVSRNILANEYRFANANPVGRVEQMTNSSTEVIWVRGGGKYFFYLSIPYITPALRTSTFTNASQSVSPRTDTMDLRMAANGNGIAVSKLYAHNSIEINGFTIDVYNGALRVNGNLVATGGVTAYQ